MYRHKSSYWYVTEGVLLHLFLLLLKLYSGPLTVTNSAHGAKFGMRSACVLWHTNIPTLCKASITHALTIQYNTMQYSTIQYIAIQYMKALIQPCTSQGVIVRLCHLSPHFQQTRVLLYPSLQVGWMQHSVVLEECHSSYVVIVGRGRVGLWTLQWDKRNTVRKRSQITACSQMVRTVNL